MPIYEYACAKCESEFEVEQPITEEPLKKCPQCGSRRVKRLISLTSFTLKGGGWYADGYGSAGGDGKAKTGDSGTASSDDTGSSKDSSDTKPEKKKAGAAKDKKAVA